VWLVYVNRPADDTITAGVRSIVEEGYLDGNSAVGSGQFMGVSNVTIAPRMFGYVPYLTEPDVMPYVVQTPGNVNLFVLADDTRSSAPDAGCNGGCLVSESFHGVTGTPGVAYAMIEGWNLQAFYNSHEGYPKDRPYQFFDVAHELIEASSDAEISDACGFGVVPWGSYSLPAFQVGGRCTVGPIVAAAGTSGADAASA
jgi:hypothetical protein